MRELSPCLRGIKIEDVKSIFPRSFTCASCYDLIISSSPLFNCYLGATNQDFRVQGPKDINEAGEECSWSFDICSLNCQLRSYSKS